MNKVELVRKELDKMSFATDVASEYNKFLLDFSCKPDRSKFPYPKVGTVIDEEKSVRWNREEAEKQRAAYAEEVARLNKEKNEISLLYEEEMVKKLAKEYGMSLQEAKVVYKYSYEKGHSDGVFSVLNEFDWLAEMWRDLKKIRKNTK